MADSLFPTKTRVALLRDVEAGKVLDDEDQIPHLHFFDYAEVMGGGQVAVPKTARVEGGIRELAQAGWIQPSDGPLWELTDAGRSVLEDG